MSQNIGEIFDKAKMAVSESNSFTFTLAKVLIPKSKISYFYCWYAYLRWVDDIADSNDTPLENRILFINSQIDLVEKLYSSEEIKIQINSGEPFLCELINFDKQNNTVIKHFIIQMLQCIQFDIKRIGKYSTSENLEFYFNKEVLSYLNTFQFFCCTEKKYLEIKNSQEGYAGKIIHILRDFIKDYEENIYNLTKEDITYYGINPYDNKDFFIEKQFIDWVRNKISEAEIKFKNGKEIIKKHPSLKYQILVLILCYKYQLYLASIKKDNYKLKREYKVDKLLIIKRIPLLLVEVIYFFVLHILKIITN